MVSKICRWNGGVFHRASCDIILLSGGVVCCSFHGNESGRCARHKVKSDVSVFSRQLRRCQF
jgi:hypothetical protein